MVGFLQSPTIEGATEEEKEDLKTQLLSDSKKLAIPNDPLYPCHPEPEDVSSSFSDSFLDFDSIGRWLMEGNPELCGEPNMADLGGNPVDFGSCVGELSVSKESFQVNGDGISKEELGVERSVEMGVCEKIYIDGVLGGNGPGTKPVGLGCLIEEKLGKVSLVGNINIGSDSSSSGAGSKSMVHGVMGMNGNGMKVDETVSDEDESDNNVKSEGDQSLSSSSSSSSGSDSSLSSSSSGEEEEEEEEEEEDEDIGAMRGGKKANNEDEQEQTDFEEGEIMLSDTDGLVAWSDNDDDVESGMTEPITSKNELKVLPPVPSVSVILQPHHQTLPVGVILSIIGAQVIVEGVEKHNPLNEGSVLWITESRSPLGIIDEIFGPVKNPYYIIRYNLENEIPDEIQQGTLISFVQEFADHVLNDKSLYQRGYDASGENDEELSDELEFSDDEKEAEYRRMLKMKKRGANESKPGTKRKEKRQQKNRTGNWNRNRDPAPQSPLSGDKMIPVTQDQHLVPPVPASLNQDKFSCSSGPRYDLAGNQALVPPFPHGPQAPGVTSGPRQDMAGNAMVTPFPHGAQGPGFVSGPRQDLAGNQAMVTPFPHGAQGPVFVSGPRQDLAGQAMVTPFPHGAQGPGFTSGSRQDFVGNQAMITPFPHVAQGPGFVSGPRQDLAGNQAMVTPFRHGAQGPGFASGPRQDLAGNQAMVSPFPHGAQGPGQDLAGNQAMVTPFPHGAQGPGFGPLNGLWSNNGFPHQQQQQSIGFPNGLPANGMLWMQQNGPFQLFQTPLQTSMAFQQQIGTIPGLPFNYNALGGQSNFVGGPMLTPWPTSLDQNTLNQSQFGMGLQAQAQHASLPPPNGGGEQGGQSQGPQISHNSQPSPESLNFNQGRGGGGRRGHHRGGRGRGRGRYQSR